MAIHWKLKHYVRNKHNLYRLKDLQEHIAEKTSIVVSLQHLSDLIRTCPKSIRLQTMEILCSALNCTLNDLVTIEPGKRKEKVTRKLSYQSTPLTKRGLEAFPNPSDYA
jgi:DNA-binding Xre family transcriptional regulator